MPKVCGVLWDNTTWTLANSPCTITSTVQVAGNVTLTIQSRVVVTKSTAGALVIFDEMIEIIEQAADLCPDTADYIVILSSRD